MGIYHLRQNQLSFLGKATRKSISQSTYIRLLILTFCGVILESVLASLISVKDVVPDVTLALSVVVGYTFGSAAGASLGALGGIVQDLLLGRYLGLNALTHFLLGSIAGSLESKVFKDEPWLLFLMLFAGSIINDGVQLTILTILGHSFKLASDVPVLTLKASLYNALVGLVMGVWLSKYKLLVSDQKLGRYVGRRFK